MPLVQGFHLAAPGKPWPTVDPGMFGAAEPALALRGSKDDDAPLPAPAWDGAAVPAGDAAAEA